LFIASVVLSALIGATPTKAQNSPLAVQRTQEVRRYPVCLECPEPRLTREARARRIKGFVALEATISEHGAVQQITVMKGLDYGLTQQAIEAVRRWRISPAIGIDGKPTALRIGILVMSGLGSTVGGFATG
jgi:TonB family protein